MTIGNVVDEDSMDNKNDELKKPTEISYYTHEAEVSRLERIIKRLWVALIMSIVIIAGFAVYEMTVKDVVVTENTQDGEGVNLIGGGDVIYGAETDSN